MRDAMESDGIVETQDILQRFQGENAPQLELKDVNQDGYNDLSEFTRQHSEL